MRFTDITINALKPPENGAVIFYDETLPGFGVRISQAGTKSFVLTHGTRRRRETIGRVGVVALKSARTEAKRRLAEYTLGKHQPRAMGWNMALQTYLAEVAAKNRTRTHNEYKRLLTKHFPFGATRLTEVSSHDLQRDLDKLTGSERFHAYVSLRTFMRWAYRRHYVQTNPMERMMPPEGSPARTRILSDQELRKIWNAAGNDTFGRIVKLLILTGQRVGEISKLTRKMVGNEAITIPATLAKNHREHTIPLGELAASHLPTFGTVLFPARGKPDHPFNGFSKSKSRLDKESGVTGWTLHDLRRTFASGLAAHGVSLHVIERMLNHVSGSFGGIVGVYQRYNYMPEMRSAIETWEKRVQTLTA